MLELFQALNLDALKVWLSPSDGAPTQVTCKLLKNCNLCYRWPSGPTTAPLQGMCIIDSLCRLSTGFFAKPRPLPLRREQCVASKKPAHVAARGLIIGTASKLST